MEVSIHAIRAAAYTASTDKVRSAINGVRVLMFQGNYICVATDSYSLAIVSNMDASNDAVVEIVTGAVTPLCQVEVAWIPLDVVKELPVSKKDGTVWLEVNQLTSGRASFKLNDEVQFPALTGLFPASFQEKGIGVFEDRGAAAISGNMLGKMSKIAKLFGDDSAFVQFGSGYSDVRKPHIWRLGFDPGVGESSPRSLTFLAMPMMLRGSLRPVHWLIVNG